jgi:hypothetical protein
MLDIIFPLSFILFAFFFLFLSKNKMNYQKLVKNNGEKFAKQVNTFLSVCGYLLLVCSFLWLAINFI